jgi:AcrR family transcriptional regulator
VPEPTPPLPALQARKHQLVRDAIQDAAIDLFAEKGFDETTVDDIAQAAGVSRRSFFRYFTSKSDLLTHGIASYGAALTGAIETSPENSSPAEVLRHIVLQVAQYRAAEPRTRKIMRITAAYPSAREAQLSRIAGVHDQVAAAFLRRFRSDRRFQDELTAQLLAGLTLAILGAVFRSWFENNSRDISLTVEQVFAALTRLLPDEAPKKRRR